MGSVLSSSLCVTGRLSIIMPRTRCIRHAAAPRVSFSPEPKKKVGLAVFWCLMWFWAQEYESYVLQVTNGDKYVTIYKIKSGENSVSKNCKTLSTSRLPCGSEGLETTGGSRRPWSVCRFFFLDEKSSSHRTLLVWMQPDESRKVFPENGCQLTNDTGSMPSLLKQLFNFIWLNKIKHIVSHMVICTKIGLRHRRLWFRIIFKKQFFFLSTQS